MSVESRRDGEPADSDSDSEQGRGDVGPWRRLDRHGSLWRRLDRHGSLWRRLDRHGSLWRRLDHHGSLWRRLDRHGMRLFWLATGAILLAQLLGLVDYSSYLYHHFDLTDDFAQYSQAWIAIGHGHLDPVDTIYVPRFPFWQSHFELAMWPLSLARWLWTQSIDLLWMQDAAIVAAEAVALCWVARICVERLDRCRNLVGVIALALLVVNPWWYFTASFDVHFEVLGLPLVVLCAYALWRGKLHWVWVSAACALLFGNVVALSIVCVGIAGWLSGRVRRAQGTAACLGLVAVGVAWTALVTVLHADQGSGVVANYAYLAHVGPHASTFAVAGGVLVHPGQVLSVVVHKLHGVEQPVGPAGVLGLATVWGAVMAVVTLVPAALNRSAIFLSAPGAFQTVTAVPFVFVGTVMVVVWIASAPSRNGRPRSTSRRRGSVVDAWFLAAAVTISGLAQGIPLLSQLRNDWWKVDAPAAGALQEATDVIPAGAEVICSQGVMGRFGSHQYLYALVAAPQAFSVNRPVVAFVFAATEGEELVVPQATEADIRYVLGLGGHLLVNRNDITVVEWHPGSGTTGIALQG